MKTTFLLLVLLSGLHVLANDSNARILENDMAKVTLSLHERDEAEPVSKPKEIRLSIACKKGYKQKKKSAVVTVCSADLRAEKGISMDSKEIKFFHYEWDAKKSSNNMEGVLYCDTTRRFPDVMVLSDFCEAKK
jgi:hypothetical protein